MSPETVIAQAFRDEADRRRQRGLTAELDTSALSFAAVAVTALEAAGYALVRFPVVPDRSWSRPGTSSGVAVAPLPYVRPDPFDPMS